MSGGEPSREAGSEPLRADGEERSPDPDRFRPLPPGPGLSREEVAADQRRRLERAMIELVATDGYEALTVRGLAKRARISTGSFYRHFRSSDECFLAAYDSIWRTASARFRDAGAGNAEPRRRVTLGVERLFEDILADPLAADFVFRDAPVAGPAFISRLRNSSMRFGLAMGRCLETDAGPQMPPPLLEGVVAALAWICRVRVRSADPGEREVLAAEAVEWIMSLCIPAPRETERLIATVPRRPGLAGSAREKALTGAWTASPGDERAMMRAAAFRIARHGYHRLSVSRIRREAGVSRRNFDRHFDGVDDCFLAALEERARRAVVAATRSRCRRAAWPRAAYRAIETLFDALEVDAAGARALFVELHAAGARAIECRDRIVTEVARALRSSANRGSQPTRLAAEASVVATWVIVRRQVAEQSTETNSALLPTLAFLAVAPATGGPAALRAIEAEFSRSRREYAEHTSRGD
jgi:AcrR family transcriptional regulator